MNYVDCILLFFFYSFIGWGVEVLEGIINNRGFINRGFLVGPICPIYGVSCLSMLFILDKYENDYIILFLLGMVICTLIEYITSLILEKIFDTRWWDYSDHKINLNGRVCLETMILFGVSGIILMKVFKPLTNLILGIIPTNIKFVIAIVLLVVMLIDLFFSIKVINYLKSNNLIKVSDCTKEVNKKVKDILQKSGYMTKRLLKSFPLLKGKKD